MGVRVACVSVPLALPVVAFGMTRVLVTGGAGFIGSHIVDAAAARGLSVAVLDNLSEGSREFIPPGVPLYEVDVRDASAVHQVLEEFRPDVVSHQAAQASVSISVRDPVLDASVNVMGGLNVLQACVRNGVKRVVFASSGGTVYGEVPEGHAALERDPKLPISPYATSKLAFETYLETYRVQFGLEYVVLRYGNVFGPRQNPHGEAGVTAIFAQRLLRGESIRVNAARNGDPAGCVRDYVYVSDVARANIAAALGELSGRTYNVGTGVGHTTLDIAEGVMNALGTRVEVQAGEYRAGDLQRCVLDVAALQRELPGITPFDEGVRRTARWFQERFGSRNSQLVNP